MLLFIITEQGALSKLFLDNCVHDKHGDHFLDLIRLRLNFFEK